MLLKKLGILINTLGIAVSGYLLYAKLLGSQYVCGISTCSVVNDSVYSYILGIPVAGLGLIFYLGMLVLVVLKEYKLFLIGSIIGLMFSAYFTYIEYFILQAFCQWCLLSAWFTVGLFVLAIRILKNDQRLNAKQSE
jgi:uncharacterized membrane protein